MLCLSLPTLNTISYLGASEFQHDDETGLTQKHTDNFLGREL